VIISGLVLLRMRKYQTKLVEKNQTHILCIIKGVFPQIILPFMR